MPHGLQQLATDAGIALCRHGAPRSLQYRVRARLAVRGRASAPRLGIFQRGSHRIVSIPDCLVHHPRINEVSAQLRAAIRDCGVEPYADGPHRGLLRYVQLVVQRSDGAVQLLLVVNGESAEPVARLAKTLQERLGSGLHSLHVNLNPERTNRILGERSLTLAGPEALQEQIGQGRVFFPVDAFGQSNLDGYENIVEQITASVPPHSRVLELYGGVGAIGLTLLPTARHVTFNEIGPGSLRGLQLGLAALEPDLRARTAVRPGAAQDCLDALQECDVVVVDPPRRGLQPQVVQGLCEQPVARLVYLSCGPQSLVRDAGALSSHYRLRELHLYDLFPHTGHLESLAVFDAL